MIGWAHDKREVRHIDLDLRDQKRRAIGVVVTITPGTDSGEAVYRVNVRATRDQQSFGASAHGKIVKTRDEVEAEIDRRVRGTRKRYASKFEKAGAA